MYYKSIFNLYNELFYLLKCRWAYSQYNMLPKILIDCSFISYLIYPWDATNFCKSVKNVRCYLDCIYIPSYWIFLEVYHPLVLLTCPCFNPTPNFAEKSSRNFKQHYCKKRYVFSALSFTKDRCICGICTVNHWFKYGPNITANCAFKCLKVTFKVRMRNGYWVYAVQCEHELDYFNQPLVYSSTTTAVLAEWSVYRIKMFTSEPETFQGSVTGNNAVMVPILNTA